VTSSALPDLVGGIQNTLTYKNFDIAALLSFSIGIKINRLRVFATAENLLTFYGHQGMDPEQTLNGATYFRYPAMRTISGGVQLSF